ncbi:Polyphosphoinositide phosphatase [Bienertia sinuspersici]
MTRIFHVHTDARVIFTRSLTFIQERFKNVNADKRIYVVSKFYIFD